MPHPSPKNKGFTLLELLLAVAVMALISISAILGLMRSQDQFRFKSVVNESVNTLRTIRNYALSNKPAPSESAPRYGAYIQADPDSNINTITIFGDTNGNNQYDPPSDPPSDPPEDHIFKTYSIPQGSAKYTLITNKDSNPQSTQTTLTIFYEPTTAKFSINESAFNQRYAIIKITDLLDEEKVNYIVLFKESGNPEILTTLDDF